MKDNQPGSPPAVCAGSPSVPESHNEVRAFPRSPDREVPELMIVLPGVISLDGSLVRQRETRSPALRIEDCKLRCRSLLCIQDRGGRSHLGSHPRSSRRLCIQSPETGVVDSKTPDISK